MIALAETGARECMPAWLKTLLGADLTARDREWKPRRRLQTAGAMLVTDPRLRREDVEVGLIFLSILYGRGVLEGYVTEEQIALTPGFGGNSVNRAMRRLKAVGWITHTATGERQVSTVHRGPVHNAAYRHRVTPEMVDWDPGWATIPDQDGYCTVTDPATKQGALALLLHWAAPGRVNTKTWRVIRALEWDGRGDLSNVTPDRIQQATGCSSKTARRRATRIRAIADRTAPRYRFPTGRAAERVELHKGDFGRWLAKRRAEEATATADEALRQAITWTTSGLDSMPDESGHPVFGRWDPDGDFYEGAISSDGEFVLGCWASAPGAGFDPALCRVYRSPRPGAGRQRDRDGYRSWVYGLLDEF